MPEKKTKKTVKPSVKSKQKETLKTVTKKVNTRAVAGKRAAKTVTSTVRTKKEQPGITLATILAIIGVLVIVALGAFLADRYNKLQNVPQEKQVPSVSYDCPEGQTALAILKVNNIVSTQDSSVGAYVDAINNNQNGNGSFWIYYINGEAGTVAPDQYTCKNGDKVEWRFEKLI